jgi:serine phosphatase RsbU (regulator of sigma subunit)
MAKPYRKELHERKSCIAFMDASPLVIDADATIEQAAALVVESRTNALADGFLIVRRGEYFGVAFGLDLMRMVAELQEAKNRQILQSIDYASVIQRAMLRTSLDTLRAELPDAAIVWEPRDIVGGDFFLCAKFEDGVFVALADCTGHGVPGAFRTLISSSWLSQTLERDGPRDPAHLLGVLNRKVKQSLGQIGMTESGDQSDDGLDALLLWIDLRERRVIYAGARMPLHSLRHGTDIVASHDTDRVGIGYVATPVDHRWQNKSLVLQQGDILLAASDGLTDQIGGPRNIAFGKRRLRELISTQTDASAADKARAIMHAHRQYQGAQRRRDDVAMFCMRVP